jgi:uncharacterized protein (DUF1800 family)
MKTGIMFLWCFLLLPEVLMGGLLPCGRFERDGANGFSSADVQAFYPFWGHADVQGDVDLDGRISVLDLLSMETCVPFLGPGLLGQYYGFHEGSEGFALSYPDFSALPAPVVVKAVDRLNHDEWAPFLNSEMWVNFAAVFTGYLWVPDPGAYTFRLQGHRGMKLFLNDTLVMGFEDNWNRIIEATVSLETGLIPLRLEFFTADHAGKLVFSWSSTGGTIGPEMQLVNEAYLYHQPGVIPPHASTDFFLRASEPSGSSVSNPAPELSLYFFGAQPPLTVIPEGGEALVLQDGRFSGFWPLARGLNTTRFQVTDAQGRNGSVAYHLTYAPTQSYPSGIKASLYAMDWTLAPLPDLASLRPFAVETISHIQLNGETLGSLPVGSRVLAVLRGYLRIDAPGWYQFRIDQTGVFLINGEEVCGLNGSFRNQWEPYGEVYLEAGAHDFEVRTGEVWQGPQMTLYWTPPGGQEEVIPPSRFSHDVAVHVAEPAFQAANQSSNGRVASGCLAEYLFVQGATAEDTSGNHFDLLIHPEGKPREPQGLTLPIAGGAFSEQGGVHSAHRVSQTGRFSLEVEFIWEGSIPEDWRDHNLFSIWQSSGYPLAGLQVRNHHLEFLVRDQEDWERDLSVYHADFLEEWQGQRVHVLATWDDSVGRLYLNGQLVAQDAADPRLLEWDKVAWLAVGNPTPFWIWDDPSTDQRHFPGTILCAALYDRALSAAEVQQNYQSNQSHLTLPQALPDPGVVTFPLATATEDQLIQAQHVLKRASFGPTRETINAVLAQGPEAFLSQQLTDEAIDESDLMTALEAMNLKPESTYTGFAYEMLARTVLSPKQLREKMTQFWENHFNTQIEKVDHPAAEARENRGFRQRAFGSFKDLLLWSAMGYPMTVYLDNVHNIVGAANENYAREIFELHAFGANNGYTQEDIMEASRCFTGWSVHRGEFHFNPGLHDYGEKVIPSLGLVIPAGGGLVDGMMLIDAIVENEHCAALIAWKLCQFFVADEPPASVVQAVQQTFQATHGEMVPVLTTLFNHPDFLSNPAYRMNKVKTPLEFVASALRLVEGFPEPSSMIWYLDRMGQRLFDYPFPTGFEEAGDYWVNTNALLYRWNFIHDLLSNRGDSTNSFTDWPRFFASMTPQTAQEILDGFESLVTHGQQASGARALIEEHLTQGQPGSFTLDAETIDQEVRQTMSLYLRLPEFNAQ